MVCSPCCPFSISCNVERALAVGMRLHSSGTRPARLIWPSLCTQTLSALWLRPAPFTRQNRHRVVAPVLSRTQASCACLTTHFPGSTRWRAAATPFFETRTVCRTLLAVQGFRCHSLCSRRTHLPPRSAVLHHPLLWLPAAPHRLSCPFFWGACSLHQSLPTRLFSSVGVRCCLSISVSVPVSVSVSISFSFCLVSWVLGLGSFVCVFVVCLRLSVSVTVSCVLRLVSGVCVWVCVRVSCLCLCVCVRVRVCVCI